MNKHKLEITLHFNFVSKKPVLVGVAVETFGWILGGNCSGQLVLRTTVDIAGEIIEHGDSRLLTKLQKAVTEYDYHANGHRTFEVGRVHDE